MPKYNNILLLQKKTKLEVVCWIIKEIGFTVLKYNKLIIILF